MVDEVGVDGVLEVSPPIVRQYYVYCFAARIRLVAGVDDLVI